MKKILSVLLLLIITLSLNGCSFNNSVYEDDYIKIYETESYFPLTEYTFIGEIEFKIKNKTNETLKFDFEDITLNDEVINKLFKNYEFKVELLDIDYDKTIDSDEICQVSFKYVLDAGSEANLNKEIITEISDIITDKSKSRESLATIDIKISLKNSEDILLSEPSFSVEL